MKTPTAWGNPWLQACALGGVLMLGQSAQLWFALRELWWGHWPLFSRWLWYTSVWGMVAMAIAGAWLGSRPRAQGGSYLLDTSALTQGIVWWHQVRPSVLVVMATQALWLCSAWLTSRSWGFGSPEVAPVAVGAMWLSTGLVLGCASARHLSPWGSVVASGAGSFLILVLFSSAPPSLPTHYIVATSLDASGMRADPVSISIFRLALLACCLVLSISWLTRSRQVAVWAFGGACVISASLYFLLPFEPVALSGADEVMCTEQAPPICIQRQESAIQSVYADGIRAAMREHPRLFSGVDTVQSFLDVDEDQTPAGVLIVPSRHGSVDMTALYTTVEDVKFSLARSLSSYGCLAEDPLMPMLVEVRLRSLMGVHPERSAQPRDVSADVLREVDPRVAEAVDAMMAMTDIEIVDFVTERRSDASACALSMEGFLDR